MNLEQFIYWKVWVLSIFYSLVQFNQACKENLYLISPDDFAKGWPLLQRMKDNSDLEWNILTMALKKFWIIFAVQVIISQVIFRKLIKLLPFFYTIFSVIFLPAMIGFPGTALYLSYIFMMYFIHKLGRKSFCYILTLCALPLLHNSRFLNVKDSIITDETQSFLFDVGLAWLLAKCLSFSIDSIDSGAYKRTSFKELPSVFSYCLYLPTMFTGPILSYELFNQELYMQSSFKYILNGLRRLLYIAFWYFVYELFMHYLYSSSIQFYPDIVSTFNGWAFCGLGYALPMMFYLKYFVIYGFSGCVASLEGFNFPPPPKCISAIHSSSFLWRHFDRGLYLWILKYLYYPLLNGKFTAIRKVLALMACFGFVCLWHGMDKAVSAWCLMNFFLVSCENIVQRLYLGKRSNKTSFFNVRLNALISTPLFIMMCLSCIFFLSNWDIGVLFMKRILFGGVMPLLPLACIMYCGCHVSLISKQWQV